MIRTYMAGSRADDPETSAARGLKSALARNAKQKAEKGRASAAAPVAAAPIAPAKAKAKTWQPPKTEAEKATFARVHERVKAVIGHPAFGQHQSMAIKLFANPRLSIAEIGNLLDFAAADTPAKQDAALSEMQAVLAEQKAFNSGAPVQSRGATGSAGVWERAYSKLGLIGETAQ